MIKEMHSSERLSILWKLDNIYLPIRRNEAALFVMKLLGSTFHIWNLIYATESTMLWN